jgi:hypothetical protein
MLQAQRLPPHEGSVRAASSSSGLGTTANTTTVGTSAGRSDLFFADGASTPQAASSASAHYGAPRHVPPPRLSAHYGARNFKRPGATVLKGGRVENAARGLGSSRSETGKWVETSKGVWAYEVAKPASVSTEVAALTARGAKDKKDAAMAEAIAKAVSDHQPAEVVLPLTFGDIFVQSPDLRWCLLHNCEVESLAVMRQICSTFMRDVPRVINSKDWQLKHRCVILNKEFSCFILLNMEFSRKQCMTLYRRDPQEAGWLAIITGSDMARPDLLMRQLASGMASSRVYSFIWTNFEDSPDSSRLDSSWTTFEDSPDSERSPSLLPPMQPNINQRTNLRGGRSSETPETPSSAGVATTPLMSNVTTPDNSTADVTA